MKKIEFRYELSRVADYVYSNSTYEFYQAADGSYAASVNGIDKPSLFFESLADVESFLESEADPEGTGLVGKTYEDPDGEWEVVSATTEDVQVLCTQKENPNFNRVLTVPFDEAHYYITGCVRTEDGQDVNYDQAVELMDDEIREQLHDELSPCSPQKFFDAYCEAHQDKYGESFRVM